MSRAAKKASVRKIGLIKKEFNRDTLRTIRPTEFLSTGIIAVDWAMGGGLPIGKMTEIFGEFSTGKTLLCLQACKTVQEAGGIAAFIDSENRFSPEMASNIGLNIEELLLFQPSCLEDVFETAANVISRVRHHEPDAPFIIVWDSIGATQAQKEMEEGMVNADGRRGIRATVIGLGMRQLCPLAAIEKVTLFFTNQLRVNPNKMYGATWYTMGGKAPEFHSTIQMMLKGKEKILDERKTVIGQTAKLLVVKNSVAPPHREVDLTIWFDRGIEKVSGLFSCLLRSGVLHQGNKDKEERKGGQYYWLDGIESTFQKADFDTWLNENPQVVNMINASRSS